MALKLPITNLQALSPGNIATLKVPVGPGAPTLDKMILSLSGGMLPAHIESVRGKANGRTFYDETLGATNINIREAYKGVFQSAAFVVLDFTEPNARNGAVEQMMSTIPLSLLQDLTFELKIAAAAPVTGKISIQGIVRQPTTNPWITKLLNTSIGFPNAGDQIIYLPTGGAGGKFKRIWIREGTANTITKVDLRIANTTVYEATRAEIEHEQKRNKLTPQANYVCIDFVEDGNLSGVMDTKRANQVELRVSSTAANNYTVFYEFVDPIGNM